MSKLLIVVDMQNDFITGALGTKEAVAIIPNVVKKIQHYMKNDDAIIFTRDTHAKNYLETQEGKNLPVEHCIKGEEGWEVCNEIKEAIAVAECKCYDKVTFGSEELAKDLMAGRYNDVTEIELVGVCTDICVISNALLVKTFLPEMPVKVDASCCAGVTEQSHKNALEAMKMCQIEIVEE
ncbi:cysteine hydrolase family protein [Anaerosporobacter sp.]|uniref:cysteine hydrolase family protein n=1 Tax=Anaerosporobacter sp. TaxID=1872529 RepID=UPI00286F9C0A|nr:isochorismatase family cysteine hydrolase [Anaerosporobacter sp.]